MTKFPPRMFRWAAIYGVLVLTPLYLMPIPPALGEVYLGLVGLALVFQGVFWVIGGDPVKYRALMPFAVMEKLAFGVPTVSLYVQGYPTSLQTAVVAGIDILLGLGFYLAWRRTPLTPA